MIKALMERLQPASGQSFIVREFGQIAFGAPYHFHPELELTYIVKGDGKRYVGNHLEDFTTGDLVLLGPNLPHCWKIEHEEAGCDAAAIVIQFGDSFLGDDFMNKPEMQSIRKLFQRSSSGVKFTGVTRDRINTKLKSLAAEQDTFRILMDFLEILQQLAKSGEYKLLDQKSVVEQASVSEQERINPVFAYLVDNFRNQVSLDKAASIANMTPNAFCKYFKKVTRKTFMEMVIDYRLNFATQQLVQTDKPISEISFESGFGDVSHFYKMFKAKMHLSPLNYRKKFMRNLEESNIRMVS